jgi:hypothetical protein
MDIENHFYAAPVSIEAARKGDQWNEWRRASGGLPPAMDGRGRARQRLCHFCRFGTQCPIR